MDYCSKNGHKKVCLTCGEGTGSRTFSSVDDMPHQLAYVTLDKAFLHKSEILIKFSSLVKMEALASGATIRLRYELFRVGCNKQPQALGSWMYEEVGSAPVVFEEQEESFSFIYCEDIDLAACCDYFVQVTLVEVNEALVTVSNGRIAAFIQTDISYSCCAIDLLCGQGNGSVVFRQATIAQAPVTIAHVATDTSCLFKPDVFIEFSSVISSAFRVQNVRLEFELFRVCDDGIPLSLGVWRFERTNTNVPSAIDNAFSFIFCDKMVSSGCCAYFVTVRGIQLDVGAPGIYLGVTVDNARITAITQLSTSDLHENNHMKDTFNKNKPNIDKAKKIQLECGTGVGSITFTSSSDPAFQLAHIAIDTSCLCKPTVNIEFSSIVSFENLVDEGNAQLRYELFRVCNNKEPVSLGIWFISRIDFRIIDQSTNSFDFIYCDRIDCPSCCDYFVTVKPVEITEGDISVTVSNGRMAALVQEG